MHGWPEGIKNVMLGQPFDYSGEEERPRAVRATVVGDLTPGRMHPQDRTAANLIEEGVHNCKDMAKLSRSGASVPLSCLLDQLGNYSEIATDAGAGLLEGCLDPMSLSLDPACILNKLPHVKDRLHLGEGTIRGLQPMNYGALPGQRLMPWQGVSDVSPHGLAVGQDLAEHTLRGGLRAAKETLSTIGHGVEVRGSTIEGAGMGLFASKDFPSGAKITKYDGEKLTLAQVLQRQRANQASHIRYIQPLIEYVDGIKTVTPGAGGASFANDGQGNNNARTVIQRCNGKLCVILVATKAIHAGEEILIDYGIEYAVPMIGRGRSTESIHAAKKIQRAKAPKTAKTAKATKASKTVRRA